MGYRDDLEAALERAEMLERDLRRASSEVSVDEGRIADLERQLKEARANSPKHDAKVPRKTTATAIAVAVAIAAIGAIGGIIGSGRRAPAPPPTPNPPAAPRTPRAAPPPGTVDVSSAYLTALPMAQQQLPDAQLMRLEAAYVDRNGVAQLGYGGEVRFRFMSPARASQPPPSAPVLGAPAVDQRLPCRVNVYADKNSLAKNPPLKVSSSFGADCGDKLPDGSPHCTTAALWQRAIDKGAPPEALASLELRIRYGKPQWHFQIYDQAQNKAVVDSYFPDDCK